MSVLFTIVCSVSISESNIQKKYSKILLNKIVVDLSVQEPVKNEINENHDNNNNTYSYFMQLETS